MKTKIRKGTDVYELHLVGAGESIIVKAKGHFGRQLTRALESIVGSPALEDYGQDFNEFNQIKVSRYRQQRDVVLED